MMSVIKNDQLLLFALLAIETFAQILGKKSPVDGFWSRFWRSLPQHRGRKVSRKDIPIGIAGIDRIPGDAFLAACEFGGQCGLPSARSSGNQGSAKLCTRTFKKAM